MLESNEELRSAVERAQAFERRHDPQQRVGVYDQYLAMLTDPVIVQPEDIDPGGQPVPRLTTKP